MRADRQAQGASRDTFRNRKAAGTPPVFGVSELEMRRDQLVDKRLDAQFCQPGLHPDRSIQADDNR